MLSARVLYAGKDLYRATPAVTQNLGFSGPVYSVASNDTQGNAKDHFFPGSSQVLRKVRKRRTKKHNDTNQTKNQNKRNTIKQNEN
jgi:hypothetical protein